MEDTLTTQREATRRAPPAQVADNQLKAVLENVQRLHAATDEEAALAGAVALLRTLLGPVKGVIVVTRDTDLKRGFGSPELEALTGPVFQRAESFVSKAVSASLPVQDDQSPNGGFAVPLEVGARKVGGLYATGGDSDRRFGPQELELVRMAAGHIGTAFDNLLHRRDLAQVRPEADEAGDGFAKGLSLHDAKLAFERRLIRARLRDANGNIAAAARVLDMDRGQLSRLLKKHGLDKTVFRSAR